MSFWPFSNPYGSSSHLQKFLDSVTDFAAVSVDNLLDDKVLQQELVDELKTISSKAFKALLFAQLLLNEAQNKSLAGGLAPDISSVTSLNTDATAGGSLLKTSREQKLLELLLQPHILNGLLDYLVISVDFFHESGNGNAVPGDDRDGEDAGNDTSESDTLDGSIAARNTSRSGNDQGEPRHKRLQRCILCSAEILSADLWVISNRIIETPSLMGKLWLVLSLPNLQESSPSLAYLIQVLGHLMESNCIELINFVRKQEHLVDTFLNKIDIPILMDFFLRIIQTDKAESPTGILAVLSRQQIVPKLMDILRPEHLNIDEYLLPDPNLLFKQTSATEFIKALVTISSNPTLAVDLDTNIGPNELTRELVSPKIISTMLNEIMLCLPSTESGPGPIVANKHGISNCVSILIELIRKNNSDYDSNYGSYTPNNQSHDGASEMNIHTMFLWLKDLNQNPPGPRDPIYLGDLLRISSDGLPTLVEVMKTEQGVNSSDRKLLGLTKFKISELVAELLHCSNMILLNSNKVAYIVRVRDGIRALQCENIQAALSESISEDTDDTHLPRAPYVSRITNGMDNISLEQPNQEEDEAMLDGRGLPVPPYSAISRSSRSSSDDLSLEDTEDEEPSVSTENPFVCDDRNKAFRANPCVGDFFKIQLVDLNMLKTIVGQFTEYPWHSFFHNVVFDLIQQVFKGKLNSYNSFLIVELFSQCNITEMIIDAFRHVKDPRPGYMGHLVLVSEEVVKFASLYKPSLISPIIVEALAAKGWEWFVSDVLLKTRELYNVVLGTDPEYSQEGDDDLLSDEGKFSFDPSAGAATYMDVDGGASYNSKNAIILGDSSNHQEFVRDRPDEEELGFDNYGNEQDNAAGADVDADVDVDGEHSPGHTKILDVPIQSMSPAAGFADKDVVYQDFAGHKVSLGNDKYLDDLPGSSSSEEDSDNQLYRVSKHHEQ